MRFHADLEPALFNSQGVTIMLIILMATTIKNSVVTARVAFFSFFLFMVKLVCP